MSNLNSQFIRVEILRHPAKIQIDPLIGWS